MPDYSTPVVDLFSLFEQMLLYEPSANPARVAGIAQSDLQTGRCELVSGPDAEFWSALEGSLEVGDQRDEFQSARSLTVAATTTVKTAVEDILTSSRNKLQSYGPWQTAKKRLAIP